MKVISVTGLIKETVTGIDYALREHKRECDMSRIIISIERKML